jgi:hypothetical protein
MQVYSMVGVLTDQLTEHQNAFIIFVTKLNSSLPVK